MPALHSVTFRGLLVRLKRWVSLAWGPRMVGGWVGARGQYLPHTRLSNHAVVFDPHKLEIGDHVFVGHFAILDASHGLTIEEGCQIGFFTGIFTHSSHAAIRLYGREYVHTPVKHAYFTQSVSIGAYTFVGAHATLLPGTRLGKGCLVSAYSLVSGEYPDFAIVQGQPAKQIGDTRTMDERLLRDHPLLRQHYEAWAAAPTASSATHGAAV